MLIHRSIAILIVASTSLAAQAESCGVPGSAFGIVAFQCANCGFRQIPGQSPTYSFFSEPVVSEVAAKSAVNTGDVIETVDGKPITTRAGADAFVETANGRHTMTVRRGRDRLDVEVHRMANCSDETVGKSPNNAPSDQQTRGQLLSARVSQIIDSLPGPTHVRIHGSNSSMAGDSLIIVDGAVQKGASSTARFGFAVACVGSCTVRSAVGDTVVYYQYSMYPTVYAVRPGSPADKAGLRVQDEITKVDGKSIIGEPGLLQRAGLRDQLRLTVRRDDKVIDVIITASPR